MAHNFTSTWTPPKATWDKVSDLAKLQAEPGPVFSCAYGCGLSVVAGQKVWVDFSSGTAITDGQAPQCPHAPASAASAASPQTITATPAPRHPRVDPASVMGKLKRDDLDPDPDVLTFDERYTATLTQTASTNLKASHTVDAPTIKSHSGRLIRQVLAIILAMLNPIWATLVTDPKAGETSKDFQVASKTIHKTTTSTDHKASSIIGSVILLIMTARGLMERVDTLQILQANIFRVGRIQGKSFTAHQSTWLKAMHTALRGDFAAIRDVLEKPDRLFNPNPHLEQNSFTVLGAAVSTRDASAIRAFFRTELLREQAEAKKIGWKPPNDDKVPTATAAGAAASASTASDSLPAIITSTGEDATATSPNKPNPKKRRRQKPSPATTKK